MAENKLTDKEIYPPLRHISEEEFNPVEITSKPTDKEIIKALECCVHSQYCAFGGGCHHFDNSLVGRQIVLRNALDLINRQQAERETMLKDLQFRTNQVIEQQAEIERLNNEVIAKEYEYNDMLEQRNSVEYNLELLKQEKSVVIAEAIKEFAERLKEKADFVGIDTEGDFLYSEFDEFELHYSVAEAVEFLSKIVLKEMVGDDK